MTRANADDKGEWPLEPRPALYPERLRCGGIRLICFANLPSEQAVLMEQAATYNTEIAEQSAPICAPVASLGPICLNGSPL